MPLDILDPASVKPVEQAQDGLFAQTLSPEQVRPVEVSPAERAAKKTGFSPAQVENSLFINQDLGTAIGLDDGKLQWALETALGVPSDLAQRVQQLQNVEAGRPAKPLDIEALLTAPGEYQKWAQSYKLYRQVTERDEKGQYRYPALANQMSDPAKATVLKDDAEHLAKLEGMLVREYSSQLAIWGHQLKEGGKRFLRSVPSFAAGMSAAQAREDADILTGLASGSPLDTALAMAKMMLSGPQAAIRFAASPDIVGQQKVTAEVFRKASKAVNEALPSAPLSREQEGVRWLGGAVAENAPQMAAIVLGALATRGATLRSAVAGGMAKPAAMATSASAAQLAAQGLMGTYIYGSTREDLLKQGRSEEAAHEASLGNAIIQGALEGLPIGRLFKTIGAANGKRAVVRALGEMVGGEMGVEFTQSFSDEFAQKYAEERDKGGSVADVLVRTWDRADLSAAAKDGFWSAVAVAPLALIMGGGAISHEYSRGVQAEQSVLALQKMAAIVDATKVKKTLPSAVEEHIQKALDLSGGKGVENVEINPTLMQAVFAENPGELQELVANLGMQKEYEAALAQDREMQIPVAKLLSAASAEQISALSQDIRPHPDMPTIRERDEALKMDKDFKSAAEEAKAAFLTNNLAAMPEKIREIRQKLQEGWTISGRKVATEDVDDNMAILWAGARRAAKSWGVSVDEWLNTHIEEVIPSAEFLPPMQEGAATPVPVDAPSLIKQEVPPIKGREALSETSTPVVELQQIQPLYRPDTKAYDKWRETLSPDAKNTLDFFHGAITMQADHKLSLRRNGEQVESPALTTFVTVQEWNAGLSANKPLQEMVAELVKSLPPQVQQNMRIGADGKIEESEFDREFKVLTSFMQRLVDAQPDVEVPDHVILPDGKKLDLMGTNGRLIVNGGEGYRQALLRDIRQRFLSGKLKQVSISSLSKDNWGTMGFLAANSKTVASGDFTTLCPQVFYNKGCLYCYRRAAMESGVNVKLAAQKIWYTGEILRLTDEDVVSLNKIGGLRIQSFGDWMGARDHVQFADMIFDAEARGLQVKIITKSPEMIEFVAHLKEQGVGNSIFFNLSTDRLTEARGEESKSWTVMNYARPAEVVEGRAQWKRALSIDEAAKYKEKYPWVNIRTVAVTLDQFIADLKDPRVDVVTGYHGHIKDPNSAQPGINIRDANTGEKVAEFESMGDSGMPGVNDQLELVRTKDGKFAAANGQPLKRTVHKELAELIEKNGLSEEYAQKACCITGKCTTCKTLCGAPERAKAALNGEVRFPVQMELLQVQNAPRMQTVQETVDPFTDLTKIKSQPWAGTIIQDKDNGVEYTRGDLVAALVRRKTNLEALLNCVRGS